MILNLIFAIFVAMLIVVVCMIKVRHFDMNLKKWTFFFIAFFYGLIFAFVFVFTYIGANNQSNIEKLQQFNYLDFIVYFVSVMLLILGVSVGFRCKIKAHGLINENNEIFLDDSNKFKRKLAIFSIFMLFVSIVTYYLYAKAYGGFLGLLDNTMAIRNGVSRIYNQWSFFQKFGSISNISAFCLFAVYMDKKAGNKLRYFAFSFWIIAVLFSFYVIYSQGGRGAMINSLLVYILTVGFRYKSNLWSALLKHWRKLCIVPIAFLIMNMAWNRTEITSIPTLISSGYSYLYLSFYVNIHSNKFRFFYDLLIMPLMFLPSSLYSKWGVTTANQFNTYLSQGGYKGDVLGGKIITGESTTGMLTFAYMQLSIVSVFIIGLLFGLCVKKWNNRLEKMSEGSFKNVLYAYYIVYFIYNGIGGGDTSALIISNFSYFLFFFIFKLCYRIKLM